MWLIKSEEAVEEIERAVEDLINNSVVIVDKHSGPASQQIAIWAKEIFGVKKAGHAGTLDNSVTGVLPIALDEATKAMPVLMGLDKEYVGVAHLHKEVSDEQLNQAVKNFIGKIMQTPPVKSAVARRPREREVKSFEILEREGKDVLFKIECQAGTYIRKIVSDLGILIGGAHMVELRRTRAGSFAESQSHSLLEVKDAYEFWKAGDEKRLREILIPIEQALPVKKVVVKDSALSSIANGSPVYAAGLENVEDGIELGDTVAVLNRQGRLVALGMARLESKEMLKAEGVTAVRTDRVFIPKPKNS